MNVPEIGHLIFIFLNHFYEHELLLCCLIYIRIFPKKISVGAVIELHNCQLLQSIICRLIKFKQKKKCYVTRSSEFSKRLPLAHFSLYIASLSVLFLVLF